MPGDGEVTIYAYAQDNGAETARQFLVPRANQTAPSVDKNRRAKLQKRVELRGSTDVFRALNLATGMQATMAGGISITVGEAAAAITTRLGSDTKMDPGQTNRLIDLYREVLGSPVADVVLRVEEIDFASGHDLENFATQMGLEIGPGEIEQ